MKEWLFRKYSENNLVDGESIVYQTTRHWINFFTLPLILSLIISFLISRNPLIQLGIITVNMVNLWIIINTDECVVTSKRVIFKTGLIITKTLEMNLTKIESLSVEQSILGKILDYGTIKVKGTGGTVETFLKVNRPLEIRKKIQEYSF
jgi:uncharacterized membrane protein YdbT with pleckstrin-like domain